MDARTLSLEKNGQRYVFRYSPGNENQILDEIVRMAEDPAAGLDWLDAATLSFQAAQLTAHSCRKASLPLSPG